MISDLCFLSFGIASCAFPIFFSFLCNFYDLENVLTSDNFHGYSCDNKRKRSSLDEWELGDGLFYCVYSVGVRLVIE